MSTAANKAVFLSYASQDAAAVQRIAEALRAAGVEVWFDQNELVGGDAWDAKIRKQIAECALFVPVISAATQARREGYFRLEWRLAAQRTHMMSESVAFLLPVVIDATRDAEADVPAEFKSVQWTRLRPAGFGGQARLSDGGQQAADEAGVAAFCARVGTLLGVEVSPVGPAVGRAPVQRPDLQAPERAARRRVSVAVWVGAIVAVAAVGGFFVLRPKPESRAGVRPPVAETASSAVGANSASVANDKSLVVLPLENLSPDPENAFFTDGMHAEIIATLQRTTDLQVIGRDTALAFKRGSSTVAEFARRVGAVNVLTGSVRRSGTKARIVVELRRASDDTLLWSSPNTERELSDVWAVQSEVAGQVARALKARESVGANAHARFLTRNPSAFDLFLKGDQRFFAAEFEQAISLYTSAFELDPGYVVPPYMLAHANCNLFYGESDPAARLRYAREGRRWIEEVNRLDASGFGAIAESHYASNVEEDNLRALELAERGMRALPHEIASPTFHAVALEGLGRMAEALESYRRATQLDPLLVFSLKNEARALVFFRREAEAIAVVKRVVSIVGVNRPFDGAAQWSALQSFRLHGALPKATESIPWSRERAVWSYRARQFAEAERAAASAAGKAGTSDPVRLELLALRHDSLLRLQRSADAAAVARELREIARHLQAAPEIGPPRKAGWLAVAEARAGQADAAVAAGRRFVDDAAPGRQQAVRWQRETAFAELYAFLNRPRECCELLAKLLRVPSGLTVPMLKVDPVWDNVRDDPAFQALLADPKNSAPL